MMGIVIKRMDMQEQVEQSSELAWIDELRHELPVFDPSRATLCDQHLQRYYRLYRFDQLPDDIRYSAGTHWFKDTPLFLQYFSCQSAKGTIVLVHGYTDHSGLYRHAIEQMLAQQWNVFTYDLQGHGVSSGNPLSIESFDQYVVQLQHLLNDYHPCFTGPVVMMGQSMGGSIVLSFLQDSTQRQKQLWSVRGGVLLAPMIRPADYDWMKRLYPFFFWWLGRLKRRFAESSHDQNFLDFRRMHDPLQYRYIPLKWIGAMLAWVKKVEKGPTCDDPLLIIQGTGDQTVNWQHNVEQLKRICPLADWCIIDDARHHLVNESPEYRQQVFQSINKYLAQYVS